MDMQKDPKMAPGTSAETPISVAMNTPVDPGDFVSTVDSTGINSANTNIEAILIKVAIYYSGKLIFCMATFCFYYCLASRLHRIHKAT